MNERYHFDKIQGVKRYIAPDERDKTRIRIAAFHWAKRNGRKVRCRAKKKTIYVYVIA